MTPWYFWLVQCNVLLVGSVLVYKSRTPTNWDERLTGVLFTGTLPTLPWANA